jgi:predicted metal-dependent hydrolase
LNGVSTQRLFEQGRVLFNGGRFFEAHEAWEELWRTQRGAARLPLQGLIQVAAGYHKAFHDRRPDGCARLLAAGLGKLRAAGLPGGCLEALAERIERDLEEAERWEKGEITALPAAPRIEEAEGRAIHKQWLMDRSPARR